MTAGDGRSLGLHVVDVAGVRHLLDVHARLLLGARDRPHNALLDDVLEVGEPAPHVAHVLEGVRPGTGVPVATERERERLTREGQSFRLPRERERELRVNIRAGAFGSRERASTL